MSDNNTMKAKESIAAGDTGCDFMKNSKINNEEKNGDNKKGKAASAAYQEIHPKIIEIDPHFAKEVERKVTKFDLIQRQA